MSLVLHVVDAFTDRPFAGNPAAVCVLPEPGEESWMQLLAAEMNLSETAFLHRIEGGWSLRWFTPAREVALCGHATLASAHCLWATGQLAAGQPARFHTLSGWLTCEQRADGIEMDFPAKVVAPCPVPPGLPEALRHEVPVAYSNGMDYLVEVPDENALRALAPDFSALAFLPVRGIIATCRSETPRFDFLSRFFAPAAGVNEDPVTGSAHCALGPYWSGKLGNTDMLAYQASARGGVVRVGLRGDRVLLGGQAVMVSRVEMLC